MVTINVKKYLVVALCLILCLFSAEVKSDKVHLAVKFSMDELGHMIEVSMERQMQAIQKKRSEVDNKEKTNMETSWEKKCLSSKTKCIQEEKEILSSD